MAVDVAAIGKNHRALKNAKEYGNFNGLIDLLRAYDVPLREETRSVIASILEGSFKRKRGKPVDVSTARKAQEAYRAFRWLTEVDQWQRDAAKERVAELMGTTKRTINAWLKSGQFRETNPLGVFAFDMELYKISWGEKPSDTYKPGILRS